MFTTNYDLAVEWSAESIDLQVVNGFLGVHGRRFSPHSFDLGFRNTQARGEARFGVYNIYLAKLHGSLTWREDSGQVYEVQAALARAGIQSFLEDLTKTELGFMVMPRAAKYMQTVGYVLGELFRRFSEFLSRPQTSLLICGYGFGDEHINRLLTSALLNPTLQLVVYSPEFSGNVLDPALPAALRKLLSLRNPRVTVIGGGAEAYLDKLAAHLPDPLLYDDEMRRLAKALREPVAPEADERDPAEGL
ncbi:SIR2-like domain protein [Burkholderia pseudomallei MSHR4003]|nr:SIR2-like domain protein [Burkholderia pseudomallei MSHR4003]